MRKNAGFMMLTLLLIVPALADAWTLTVKVAGGTAAQAVTVAYQTSSNVQTTKTLKVGTNYLYPKAGIVLAAAGTPTYKINGAAADLVGVNALVAGPQTVTVTYTPAVVIYNGLTLTQVAGGSIFAQNLNNTWSNSSVAGYVQNALIPITIAADGNHTITGYTVAGVRTAATGKVVSFTVAANGQEVVPEFGVDAKISASLFAPTNAVAGKTVTLSVAATSNDTGLLYNFVVNGVATGFGASASHSFAAVEGNTVVSAQVKSENTATPILIPAVTIVVANAQIAANSGCVSCHSSNTPAITADYGKSAHYGKATCQACHSPEIPHSAGVNAKNIDIKNGTFTVISSAANGVAKGAIYCTKCHSGTNSHPKTGNMANCAVCHTATGHGDAHQISVLSSNATCLSASCHGNPALVKTITVPGGTETVPLYVNKTAYEATTHGSKLCASCHTDIILSNGGHANVAKTYGGWSRFSKSQAVDHVAWGESNIAAGAEATRNYVTAASRSCTTCHTGQNEFGSSAHATIFKQREAHIDASLTAIATVCEGKATTIGEDWGNGNCNRCHATCGTCHFKSTISLKGAYPVANKWDEVQQTDKIDGATVPDPLSEYQMNWTDNVASHDFRPKSYFATDSEGLCNACHTGYYRPAGNGYYWKGSDHTADTTTCDESAGSTWARVKATNVRRHPQATELKFSGYTSLSISGGENTEHGNMTCNDCHGTASGKNGNIHNLPGEEYLWATQGDIQCADCHTAPHNASALSATLAAHSDATGTKVACIACHSFGLARDFALAKGAAFDTISTTHNVFIDPVTGEVRPVVKKNGHAIAWYPHNWQSVNPGTGKLDQAGDCAKKCHYQGNIVGAGTTP